MSKNYISVGSGVKAKAVQYTGNNFEECCRFSGGLLYNEDGSGPTLWGHVDGDVNRGDWLVVWGKDDLAKLSNEKFRSLFPQEINP